MRNSKWYGLVIYLALIGVCFLPWTYHADLHQYFTGFYSEKNVYGKPGKFIMIFSLICILLMFVNKTWVKFAHLFLSGIMLAYVLKTYHLYTSSYMAYTPEKQAGIYLLLLLSIASFVVSMLPEKKS